MTSIIAISGAGTPEDAPSGPALPPSALNGISVLTADGEVHPARVAMLATALATLDDPAALRTLPAGELVELVALATRMESYAASAARRAAAALHARADLGDRVITARQHNAEKASGRDVTTPARYRTFHVSEAASDEIAMRLGITRPAAARMIGEGRTLDGNLTWVGQALTDGHISPAKATVFVQTLREEPVQVCLAVIDQVLPQAGELTPAELERRIRAHLIATDPDVSAERHRRATRLRHLSRVQLLPEGMGRLSLTTTLADATAVHTSADLAARAAKAAGDPRTLDQLRADALTALATHALHAGHLGTAPQEPVHRPPDQPPSDPTPDQPPSDPTHPGNRPLAASPGTSATGWRFDPRGARVLRIRADLADQPLDAPLPPGPALAWDRHLFGPAVDPPPRSTEPWCPGWLAPEILGYGPLDHATARALANDPPPWLTVSRLTETDQSPRPGSPGTAAEAGYLPSAALRRAVVRAFPTCIAPTCTIASSSCQLDHAIPYPEGATSAQNLRPLCQHHHILKTHQGHSYTLDAATGTVAWTTATGHVYIHGPDGTAQHIPPSPPG